MKEIPIKAKVQCTDGSCGSSTNVIFDRTTRKVTHVAIKYSKLPDNPTRLVPVENVENATHDLITLNCSRDELAKMDPYSGRRMVQQTDSGMAGTPGQSAKFQHVHHDTGYSAVNVHNVPHGEMAILPEMNIIASDSEHSVGKLDELVLDPKSGAITHVLMMKGHLWGKKEVAIPVESVGFTDGKNIYLNIDKDAVNALPTVPINR